MWLGLVFWPFRGGHKCWFGVVDWFEMGCFVLVGDSWVGFGRKFLGCRDFWVCRLGRIVIIRPSLG